MKFYLFLLFLILATGCAHDGTLKNNYRDALMYFGESLQNQNKPKLSCITKKTYRGTETDCY